MAWALEEVDGSLFRGGLKVVKGPGTDHGAPQPDEAARGRAAGSSDGTTLACPTLRLVESFTPLPYF